jgi:hypothetical protein
MSERSFGYEFTDPDSDVYYGWLDGKPAKIDRLIPTETPLHFSPAFINVAATDDSIPNLGTYTNGWEL